MPRTRASESSRAAAARTFAPGSARAASGLTPARAAPRRRRSPRSAMTPNAAGRPGNSSSPSTICQRVSSQATARSSSGGTPNSRPAASKASS